MVTEASGSACPLVMPVAEMERVTDKVPFFRVAKGSVSYSSHLVTACRGRPDLKIRSVLTLPSLLFLDWGGIRIPTV